MFLKGVVFSGENSNFKFQELLHADCAWRNISTELSEWNIYVNQNKSLKEQECINSVNYVMLSKLFVN